MKTKIFALMMALMPCSNVCVNAVPVPVNLSIIDPTEDQGEPQRGPVLVPEVSIDDYILSLDTSCYGYTLRLVDEDDNVVFSTVITSTTVILPSTLEGEYELQLIPTDSSIYFYGYVLF